jgi:hypothetical protein
MRWIQTDELLFHFFVHQIFYLESLEIVFNSKICLLTEIDKVLQHEERHDLCRSLRFLGQGNLEGCDRLVM